MPPLQRIIYPLLAVASACGSVGAERGSAPSGVGGVIGWHTHAPSFISTKKSTIHNALFGTRGGSSTEEEASTAVIDAEADVDIVADADDTSNATEADTDQLPANLTFGATKPHDGSVDDPDGMPTRFLTMKKGDREGAKEAFLEHLAWRAEFNVDAVLSRPHTLYDVCKAMVPHFFAGRDPHNNVVFVQRPAALDFELMKKNNATIDDLLNHYIWVIEYCWNIFEPGPPEGVMTNVLDMRGLSFSNMRNQEYIGFGKRFVNMMSSNYPGRSYKTLVVNAPKWFHALYKVFKPLLRETTRAKIVILKAGEKQDTALKFYLGDSLPKDLLSGEKHDATEPGQRYFMPIEDRDQCESGPNALTEYDMRQFVSLFCHVCVCVQGFCCFMLSTMISSHNDDYFEPLLTDMI